MGDNKMKIAIMAGVLALLIVGFVLFILRSNGNNAPTTPTPGNNATPSVTAKSTSPGAPSAAAPAGKFTATPSHSGTPGSIAKPGMTATTGHPTTVGGTAPGTRPPAGGMSPLAHRAPGAGMTPIANRQPVLSKRPAAVNPAKGMLFAGKPGMPAAFSAPQPPKLNLPPPPQIASMQQVESVLDPFVNGPVLPPPPKPKPWPQMVLVSVVPPEVPYHPIDNRNIPPTAIRRQGQAFGRMAGWIYNSNGQITAIFEDTDGIAHSVHVGDQIGNLTVKSISPEFMEIVDDNGSAHKLKMQSLDNYAGANRTVNVVPTPSPTPAWRAP